MYSRVPGRTGGGSAFVVGRSLRRRVRLMANPFMEPSGTNGEQARRWGPQIGTGIRATLTTDISPGMDGVYVKQVQ